MKLPDKKSVRHGDAFSPKLFSTFMGIFKKVEWDETEAMVRGKYLHKLRLKKRIHLLYYDTEKGQGATQSMQCMSEKAEKDEGNVK